MERMFHAICSRAHVVNDTLVFSSRGEETLPSADRMKRSTLN
jgi:hypothetical protein